MAQPRRRLYYFCPPDYALENFEKQRLKVARFSKCNDPFELAAFNLRNKQLRGRFREWLRDTDHRFGLLCFTKSWRSPVLWSHYAKDHTGVCFAFDVMPHNFVDVRYVSERLYPDLTLQKFLSHVGEGHMEDLFATKFLHWSYEEEVRLLINFNALIDPDEHRFHEFSDELKLAEIILGPKCKIPPKTVNKLIEASKVKVSKARLAFQNFSVVRQQNRSLW